MFRLIGKNKKKIKWQPYAIEAWRGYNGFVLMGTKGSGRYNARHTIKLPHLEEAQVEDILDLLALQSFAKGQQTYRGRGSRTVLLEQPFPDFTPVFKAIVQPHGFENTRASSFITWKIFGTDQTFELCAMDSVRMMKSGFENSMISNRGFISNFSLVKNGTRISASTRSEEFIQRCLDNGQIIAVSDEEAELVSSLAPWVAPMDEWFETKFKPMLQINNYDVEEICR